MLPYILLFNAVTMITAYLLGFYIISTFSLGIAFSPSFSANSVGISINKFKDYHSTVKTQMGKYDTCSSHIGIEISLSDLISQINETNFDLIQNMLEEGFIEDNVYYNDLYINVIGAQYLPKNALEFKEFLLDLLENEPFFHDPFLIPVKELLEVDIQVYGRYRYGTNGVSRPATFKVSLGKKETERYKVIKKKKIVFILKYNTYDQD